ncbi:MAG: helix-turn-helix transcriptional regulator [Lachnospiraceae bacterium]|nr:helix-turn-helix transcriptional regulator [Lachnospiraceae bacterium]
MTAAEYMAEVRTIFESKQNIAYKPEWVNETLIYSGFYDILRIILFGQFSVLSESQLQRQVWGDSGSAFLGKGGKNPMYAMDFAQVGANIQRQIQVKGFTQQSLADALGISKQVMNKIIKGNKAINVNELARIASVIGTTTDELLTADREPVSEDSLSFMGSVTDEETLERVNRIRSAIDEIHLLEELLDA